MEFKIVQLTDADMEDIKQATTDELIAGAEFYKKTLEIRDAVKDTFKDARDGGKRDNLMLTAIEMELHEREDSNKANKPATFEVGQRFIFEGFATLPDDEAVIIGFTKTQVKFEVTSGYDGKIYIQRARLKEDADGAYIRPYDRYNLRPADAINQNKEEI